MEDFTILDFGEIDPKMGLEGTLRLQRNHTLRQVSYLLGEGRDGKLVAMVAASQRYGDPPLAALGRHFAALVDEDEKPPEDAPALTGPPPSADNPYLGLNRNELVALCHERGLTAPPTTTGTEARAMLEEQDRVASATAAPEAHAPADGESIRA
jgi:hypothetical protein